MKAIIFITAIIAAIGVWFIPPATSQEVLPEQSPLITACNYATAAAGAEKLTVTRCRLVALQGEGQNAFVTIQIWIEGYGKFIAQISLFQSIWDVQSFRVEKS